jgi:predicted outer membrane protein
MSSHHHFLVATATVALLATAALGCSHPELDPGPLGPVSPLAATSDPHDSPPPGKLSDGQVAELVRAVGERRLERARLAQERAVDPRVRRLAHNLVDDFRAATEAHDELVKSLGLKRAGSAELDRLLGVEDAAQRSLAPLAGAEFDRAFLDTVVERNDSAIALFDSLLLPEAREPELVSWLRRLRPLLAAHADGARRLREALR